MLPLFDVFKVEKDSEHTWVESADSLVIALSLIQKEGPGSYLILSHVTGRKDIYEVSAEGSATLQRL